MKKAFVVVFPGSNCDDEMFMAFSNFGFKVEKHWYQDEIIPNSADVVAVPGGFSYGDYLRSGAIAASFPIMKNIKKFADKGGYVIGVCNGFQILTEAKILPGALMRNKNGNFVCKTIDIEVNKKSSIFTKDLQNDVKIQVAHADGQYFASSDIIDWLEKENRIAFRYKNNFNGSMNSIAGIIGGNDRNILGMMPHPERFNASTDCLNLFKSILES